MEVILHLFLRKELILIIKYLEQAMIENVKEPFDFDYHLNYYVIYPWIRKDNSLIRILTDQNGQLFKVTISQIEGQKKIQLSLLIESEHVIRQESVLWIKDKIAWCLGCYENMDGFKKIVEDDYVLMAAMQNKWGRRNKSTPTLFEGMLNVICAQNVQFSRVYSMSYNLSYLFGKELVIDGEKFYAFPNPGEISGLSIEQIKEAKVGYRAKVIKAVADFLVEMTYDEEQIYHWEDEKIKEFVTQIKGVGPYTANLVLAVAFRRSQNIHLDSYVKEILNTFYIKVEEMTDEEIIRFCTDQWGRYAAWVISLLTTDTEEWAEILGVKMFVRSGAHIKHNKVKV